MNKIISKYDVQNELYIPGRGVLEIQIYKNIIAAVCKYTMNTQNSESLLQRQVSCKFRIK